MEVFKIKEYESLLSLIQKYENANMKDIKNNLFKIRKDKNLKKGFLKELGISESQEKSFITEAHSGNIPFTTLIKICNLLEISFDDLLSSSKKKINKNLTIQNPNVAKNRFIRWSTSAKIQFLKDVDVIGISKVANKYNLRLRTVEWYIDKFERELKTETK